MCRGGPCSARTFSPAQAVSAHLARFACTYASIYNCSSVPWSGNFFQWKLPEKEKKKKSEPSQYDIILRPTVRLHLCSCMFSPSSCLVQFLLYSSTGSWFQSCVHHLSLFGASAPMSSFTSLLFRVIRVPPFTRLIMFFLNLFYIRPIIFVFHFCPIENSCNASSHSKFVDSLWNVLIVLRHIMPSWMYSSFH